MASVCPVCNEHSDTGQLCPTCVSAFLQDPKPPPPTVVRLKRKGGRVVQDCDVYIGRRWTAGGWDLPESPWANPFTVRQCGTAAVAVEKFREYVQSRPDLMNRLHELGGKQLGCWCKPGPCHGDVLVDLYKAL
jgi:hypothetical protein